MCSYEYLHFRASSVSPSFQSGLGFQPAVIRYMQAPFQYLSIATQPSNHFSPHTCHTYHSSQVRMNHQNEHVHHFSELFTRISEKIYNRSQCRLGGLLSIQTIQHALYQLSLALFWFLGLLINRYHHAYAKLCTFPFLQSKQASCIHEATASRPSSTNLMNSSPTTLQALVTAMARPFVELRSAHQERQQRIQALLFSAPTSAAFISAATRRQTDYSNPYTLTLA